jgi:hypothetical protein
VRGPDACRRLTYGDIPGDAPSFGPLVDASHCADGDSMRQQPPRGYLQRDGLPSRSTRARRSAASSLREGCLAARMDHPALSRLGRQRRHVLATRSDSAARDAYTRATKAFVTVNDPAARTRNDARESCTGGTSHRRRRSVAYSAGACALRRGARRCKTGSALPGLAGKDGCDARIATRRQ